MKTGGHCSLINLRAVYSLTTTQQSSVLSSLMKRLTTTLYLILFLVLRTYGQSTMPATYTALQTRLENQPDSVQIERLGLSNGCPPNTVDFAEWVQNPLDLGIGVPSAVMDISYNVLLHPRHRLYQDITSLGSQDLMLGQRLWKGPIA